MFSDQITKIRQVTFEANFYHVLWRLLVTTPYVRQPALIYLNDRLPKAENLILADSQRASPFKESLVVKGLVAALQDNNVFVLRIALDILVGHFKLDRGLFSETRLTKLVGAAMAIIVKRYLFLSFIVIIILIIIVILLLSLLLFLMVRKDVSLNRRLYTWLLGTGDTVNSIHYFEAYSKGATVRAIADSFEAAPTSSASAVLPYKILGGLIEKDDIFII